MKKVKITGMTNDCCWIEDKKKIVGETYRLDGSRFYPLSEGAVNYCAKQGVDYIVLIGTVKFEILDK